MFPKKLPHFRFFGVIFKTITFQRRWKIFFPYDLLTVNDCLSDTLEKAKFGTNSSLQNTRKDNLNKLIFAHLNINSIWNMFDSLADMIKDKDNIDTLMISETKVDDSCPDG